MRSTMKAESGDEVVKGKEGIKGEYLDSWRRMRLKGRMRERTTWQLEWPGS